MSETIIITRDDISNPLYPALFENLVDQLMSGLKGKELSGTEMLDIDQITLTVSNVDVE